MAEINAELFSKLEKAKKKEIVDKVIDKSKDISPDFHQIMVEQYFSKQKDKRERILDRFRLENNLEKADKDIEKHAERYPLSCEQEMTRDRIKEMLKILKEKEIKIVKDTKEPEKELSRDRGMSF